MVGPQMVHKVSLETELKRFPKLRVEDIATVQQWLQTQHHMPSLLDVQIAHVLHACYYNVELTKTTIYKNVKYKSTMPEFFTNWSSQSEVIDFARKAMLLAVLPKNSQSDSRYLIVRMTKNSAEHYDLLLSIKLIFMTYQSILLVDGLQEDFKIIIEADTFTFTHLKKMSLPLLKKHSDFSEKAAFVRVTAFHLLDANSIMTNFIGLCRSFANKERFKMIHFHSPPEDFFKNLAPEVIPSDYGGTAPSLETLAEENIRRIQENRDSLVAYSEQKLIESKIPVKKKRHVKMAEEFKKLELD